MPKTKAAPTVEKIRCPNPACGSSQVVTRKTDRTRWCRKCLTEWSMDGKKSKAA